MFVLKLVKIDRVHSPSRTTALDIVNQVGIVKNSLFIVMS